MWHAFHIREGLNLTKKRPMQEELTLPADTLLTCPDYPTKIFREEQWFVWGEAESPKDDLSCAQTHLSKLHIHSAEIFHM